jgi:hypothetical protein
MTPQFREIQLDPIYTDTNIFGAKMPVLSVFAQESRYLFYLEYDARKREYIVCGIPPGTDIKTSYRVPSFAYTLAVGESITKLKLRIAKKLFGILTKNLGDTENYLYITKPDLQDINNKNPTIYVAVLALA